MSVYWLCDKGISYLTVKKLYDANITIKEIEKNPECLKNVLGINSIGKINKIKIAIQELENSNCNNEESIFILYEYDLTITIINNLKSKNITISMLRNSLSIDKLVQDYDFGCKVAQRIYIALGKYDGKNYLKEKQEYHKLFLKVLYDINKETININEFENIETIRKLELSKEILLKNLKTLELEQKIKIFNNEIEVLYLSLDEAINNLKKQEWKEILLENLDGKNLADIGRHLNLSRERIRQIVEKSLKHLHRVKEDKYASLFKRYRWSEEIFCTLFNCNKRVYSYLSIKYQLGNEDISKIIEQNILNDEQEKKLKQYLNLITHKNYTILANKTSLLKLILKLSKKQMDLKDLCIKYNEIILEENFLSAGLEKMDLNNLHTAEALLTRTNNIIVSFNRRYRYFDYDSLDQKDLIFLYNMLNVNDGVYSSEWFFKKYINFMEQIDIRDKYELHSLLKKFNTNEKIKFGRMPDIYINCINKQEFLIEQINLLSPISVKEFVDIISTSYGHNKESISSYLYNFLSEFITNDIINTKVEELTLKETTMLNLNLTKNIYSIQEIELLLEKLLNKNCKKYINNINMNHLGYKVREQYVYRKEITSIDAYLREMILKNDVYTENEELKAAGSSYQWVFFDLLLKNQIYRIDDNTYITHQGLKNRNITIDEIERIQNKIYNEFKDKEVFNLEIIKKRHILDEFQCLGFNDIFYLSLLQYTKGIKILRIEGNTLYCKTNTSYVKRDFINNIVKRMQPISIRGINQHLYEIFNFKLNQYDIRNLINKDIYYIDIETDIVQERTNI